MTLTTLRALRDPAVFVHLSRSNQHSQFHREAVMENFVFWTGIYDLVVGIGFFIPGMAEFLGIKQPESPFYPL